MIGATILGWMKFMCRYGDKYGKNFDQSWGGLPVVITDQNSFHIYHHSDT
jgi:hypothetical protein